MTFGWPTPIMARSFNRRSESWPSSYPIDPAQHMAETPGPGHFNSW